MIMNICMAIRKSFVHCIRADYAVRFQLIRVWGRSSIVLSATRARVVGTFAFVSDTRTKIHPANRLSLPSADTTRLESNYSLSSTARDISHRPEFRKLSAALRKYRKWLLMATSNPKNWPQAGDEKVFCHSSYFCRTSSSFQKLAKKYENHVKINVCFSPSRLDWPSASECKKWTRKATHIYIYR